MKGRWFAVLAAVFMVFTLAANSQAGLTRVVVDAFTINYPNPAHQQLIISIAVNDGHDYRGPDFVKSITVLSPDKKQKFSLHPAKDWRQYDRVYSKAIYASDFTGGKILGGTYKATVVPFVGKAIQESDSVTGKFLPIPVLTSPLPGATGVESTPTITWNPVDGASYYSIQLWNNTSNEPVYWTWDKQTRTNLEYFKIPLGELQPNCQYKLRIEARSSTQDLDMRARNDWVTFTTGSW